VNLGNPTELTILEFGRLIANLVGSESKLAFEPLPADDPRRRRPDISKAKRLLDWEPKVVLEDGLRETVEYFKSAVTW
jgi:nucleoside-diphosphate-sugar epimerase